MIKGLQSDSGGLKGKVGESPWRGEVVHRFTNFYFKEIQPVSLKKGGLCKILVRVRWTFSNFFARIEPCQVGVGLAADGPDSGPPLGNAKVLKVPVLWPMNSCKGM